MADALPCLLCERALPAEPSARALTDCAHEFCLSCLCRALAARKNRCPACGAAVRAVHQLQAEQAAAPASVRFCNATYVLNVSIWDVQDPARVLAGLFNLEHARLIHRGKLLKKGDVWPGTLVQLFGTIKSSSGAGAAGGRDGVLASLTSSTSWLQQFLASPQVRQILCCPCSVLLDFVRSLFGGGELEREQRGYRRVATADVEAGPSSRFHEPGRVSAPPSTDSL